MVGHLTAHGYEVGTVRLIGSITNVTNQFTQVWIKQEGLGAAIHLTQKVI